MSGGWVQTEFPDVHPVARATDPGTSWAAAASVRHITDTHKAILGLLAACPYGATDQELAALARRAGLLVSDSGLRTRRCELVTRGLVRDTGRRGLTLAGRHTIIWEAAR